MTRNRSLYFDEEGYTLILVTIMTSILLLIGLTVSKLCIDNYKMKNLNSICKKNFYVAEALSEEADMKLYEYLKVIVYNSYEIVLKYVIENDEDYDMDVEIINKEFKSIFKHQIKTLKDKLENENDYNLKIVEEYNVRIEIILEESLDTDSFNISILSSFKDKNITEKIKTKYNIRLPEYIDFEHNKNLIEKIDWVNYKW